MMCAKYACLMRALCAQNMRHVTGATLAHSQSALLMGIIVDLVELDDRSPQGPSKVNHAYFAHNHPPGSRRLCAAAGTGRAELLCQHPFVAHKIHNPAMIRLALPALGGMRRSCLRSAHFLRTSPTPGGLTSMYTLNAAVVCAMYAYRSTPNRPSRPLRPSLLGRLSTHT